MTVPRITHTNQQYINTTPLQERTNFQNVKKVYPEIVDASIRYSVELNSIEAVKSCLAHGPISDVDRGFAVCIAVRNGNEEIVELILANGPISEETRGLGVVSAAHKNHPKLAVLLLTNGPISKENREWAIVRAANNGNRQLVELLLDKGPISEFSQASQWQKLLEEAAKSKTCKVDLC